MEEGDKQKSLPFLQPPSAKSDEEEKMEKFYELISNLKPLISSIWESEAPKKRMRSEILLWKPTFEWEDFAGISDSLCPISKEEEDGKKKSRNEIEDRGEAESTFDLELSL